MVTRFGLGVNDLTWLEHRLALMSAITIPSLTAQSEPDFAWAVLVDDSLPRPIRSELMRRLEPLEDARLVDGHRFPFTNHGFLALADLVDPADQDRWVLTARLDDDDAWDVRTVERIRAILADWMGRPGRSRLGLGITFPALAEWTMTEIVDLRRLERGAVRTPGLRKVAAPFSPTSVFVMASRTSGISACSTGYPGMEAFLRRSGLDVEVVETDEPASLSCRHRHVNAPLNRKDDGSPAVEPDLRELSRTFGIDSGLTREYLAQAEQVPHLLENRPNHRRRETRAAIERLDAAIARAPSARMAARHRAQRRLLIAETARLDAVRVASTPALLKMRGSTGTTGIEQIAELRGMLAERERSVDEARHLLEESEFAAVVAERSLDRVERRLTKTEERLRRRERRLARHESSGPIADVMLQVPELELTRVFDVGANVGKTVVQLSRTGRVGEVWAFEPVPEAFALLQAATAEFEQVRCWPLALGAVAASGRVTADGASVLNHLVDPAAPGQADGSTVPVDIVTGDGFCAMHAVERVAYVKIDTEGHDLDVLRGFEGMLAGAKLDVVEVEAGMSRDNERHVPFEQLNAYLEDHGYALLRLYDQVPQGPGGGRSGRGGPHLRRVNAVYLSPATIELGRGAGRHADR